MGSYRQHVGFASFVGAWYAWALYALAGIHWIYGSVAALLATIGGLLPDLDSESGVEMRGFTGMLGSTLLTVVFVPSVFVVVQRFEERRLARKQAQATA